MVLGTWKLELGCLRSSAASSSRVARPSPSLSIMRNMPSGGSAGRRDGASRREEEVGQVLDGLGGLGAAELDKRRDERSSEDFLDVLIVSAPQLALHWRSSTRAPLPGPGPAPVRRGLRPVSVIHFWNRHAHSSFTHQCTHTRK